MKSKFCLTSTAGFDKINKAPTNKSTTKQTFSFSKGNRFQLTSSNCPHASYGGDFIQRKPSGAGIGYGTRSDFTKCLTNSPSASKYKIKTFWQDGVQRKRGPSFALNRQQVSFNSYISQQKIAVPASNTYQNDKIFKQQNSPKYTLRQKTVIKQKKYTIQPQNTNPGPGSYINPEDQLKNSRSASKYQRLSYSQSKNRRFDSSQTISPGPGKYQDLNSMSKTGKYIISKHEGGTKAKFDSDKRETMFDKLFRKQLENPGPGYYQIPSQFGQYDGDIYNEFRQSKRSNNGWKIQTQRKSERK